jgi:hypothetical protein
MRAAAAGCGIGGFAGMGGCHDPNGLGEVVVDDADLDWPKASRAQKAFVETERFARAAFPVPTKHVQQKHSPIQTPLNTSAPAPRLNPTQWPQRKQSPTLKKGARRLRKHEIQRLRLRRGIRFSRQSAKSKSPWPPFFKGGNGRFHERRAVL